MRRLRHSPGMRGDKGARFARPGIDEVGGGSNSPTMSLRPHALPGGFIAPCLPTVSPAAAVRRDVAARDKTRRFQTRGEEINPNQDMMGMARCAPANVC
jgi:hypothetical protein